MKSILIGCGASAVLLCVALAGVVVAGLMFLDIPAHQRKFDEGRRFGRTTDRQGCLDEALSRAKARDVAMDFDQALLNKSFVNGCFQTSAERADFCRDVPPVAKEIAVTDEYRKYRSVACERLKFGVEHRACRIVMNAKADFCWTNGKSTSDYPHPGIFESDPVSPEMKLSLFAFFGHYTKTGDDETIFFSHE